MPDLTPPPHGVGMISERTGFMSKAWIQWFDDIRTRSFDGHKSLQNTTIDSNTTIDLTKYINKDYNHYKLVLQDVKVSQPTGILYVRTSDDTGTTFNSGATDYTWILESNSGSLTTSSDSEDSKFQLISSGLGNTSSSIMNGVIEFFTPSNTTNGKFFRWDLSYKNNSGSLVLAKGTGIYNGTAAINALRLYLSTGSFSSGSYTLYGVR